MENLILTEYKKSSSLVLKKAQELGPSYAETMHRAFETFLVKGIPTKKQEDWIYTNIGKTLAHRFYVETPEATKIDSAFLIDKKSCLIFNNGIFNPMDSILPEGLSLDGLLQKESHDFFDAFDALNYSTALSPICLRLKKNAVLNSPLTIVHLNDEQSVNKVTSPRLHFTLEPFSKISIVEVFTSTNNSLFQYTTNASTTFELKENAKCEHVKINFEAKSATHIGLTKANLASHSTFHSMTIDLGILSARHNLEANIYGVGAEAHVNGLFALKKSEHSDVFSHINHLKDHTQSSQLFKGIMGDESHGAFTGKISIAKDAQQVNSEQLNKNLMLSKKAHIDTRPQLLVAADDVKCSHGATIGQLSSEEAFYLESRGIDKDKAKKMLCLGFAMDVLLKIEDKKLLTFVEEFVKRHLNFDSSLSESQL
jgi:Fe-S cluster assembly protein SufD